MVQRECVGGQHHMAAAGHLELKENEWEVGVLVCVHKGING